MEDFDELWFETEGIPTGTSIDQCACEKKCSEFLMSMTCYTDEQLTRFKKKNLVNDDNEICLLRDSHTMYLSNGLLKLSSDFVSLDASRPWIMYWICHALHLLQQEPYHLYPRIIDTLSYMQVSTGGYGGGPGQLAHCATTYAAVLVLCTIGTDEAYTSIDRMSLYHFFMSMKDEVSGGFRMHRDGEVDSRGTYTVVSIARILNILTPELMAGAAEYLLACQSYEGGFGSEPGAEAHGGYNFCSLAALLIMKQLYWLSHRQLKVEGGFQGRTNKLVDACYSYWQGGAMALCELIRCDRDDIHDLSYYTSLLHAQHHHDDMDDDNDVDDKDEDEVHVKDVDDEDGSLLFNQKKLQQYILHCGQNLDGGLRDKPGKPRDFYHSCYALSGLSISQHSYLYTPTSSSSTSSSSPVRDDDAFGIMHALVYGDVGNLLQPTSCVYNIGLKKLHAAISYFEKLSCDHQSLIA